MPDQDYINQEVSRHHNHVESLRSLPRLERLENVADLMARMQFIDAYARDCESVMRADFGFAMKHLFWNMIDNNPRMNHVAYLAQLVAIVCNVEPVAARRAYNKLPASHREALNARIQLEIADAMQRRKQS